VCAKTNKEPEMGRSESGRTMTRSSSHRGPSTDEVLARTLAQASVEVDELCAEHGTTPELLETRQAIEAASAALWDFVDGERPFDEELQAGGS
jgi:hypothetical protein